MIKYVFVNDGGILIITQITKYTTPDHAQLLFKAELQ